MKIFVGFGYNDRDQWIEDQVVPILRGMGFTVVDGKDMHGEMLQPEVKTRIDQCDAAVGFFTVRADQGNADFTSHIWVRDEMVYANARGKPIVPIVEKGAKVPVGLLGDRQYIPLDQNDRLGCAAELVKALERRNIRRLRLEPATDDLYRRLHVWRRTPGFTVRYRTQDNEGMESAFREGRLELIDSGFYLNVADVPRRAYVEVEGVLGADVQFSSGLSSADAVLVKIF